MFEPNECVLSVLENWSDEVLFWVEYFLLEAIIYVLTDLASVVAVDYDFSLLV